MRGRHPAPKQKKGPGLNPGPFDCNIQLFSAMLKVAASGSGQFNKKESKKKAEKARDKTGRAGCACQTLNCGLRGHWMNFPGVSAASKTQKHYLKQITMQTKIKKSSFFSKIRNFFYLTDRSKST